MATEERNHAMTVSRKTTTTDDQVVTFTFEDIALAAVNQCLSDPNGFIGASSGTLQIRGQGTPIPFTVHTDDDTGEVRVSVEAHLKSKQAFTASFQVTR